MEKNIVLLSIIWVSLFNYAYSQNDSAIFLHHSTGGGVYNEGNVEQWTDNYNSDSSTNYFITEQSYPNSPWPWENYPYDYWKLWINGDCDNNTSGIRCIDYYAARYELIIFKHCYPGAGIGEDSGDPDIASKNKTIGNYKAQYRALRNMMDNIPGTKFMIWTLAPLHRNATNADDAARAHEFVEWVKNDFLTEDSKEHKNIFIFDFYGLVAELSASPANGQQYCLKYDYEGSHDGSDSHPNSTANEYAGPIFAKAIVDALISETGGIIINSTEKVTTDNVFDIRPNPNNGEFRIAFSNNFSYCNLKIIASDGRLIQEKNNCFNGEEINLSYLPKGYYFINIISQNKSITKPILIE
jgi:hypothetical protein